jgi:hypothetical protein
MTIPAGFAQITYVYTGASVPRGAANVIGVENAGGLSIANVAIAAGEAIEPMMANLPDSVQVNEIRVKLGPDDNGPYQVFPIVIPGVLTSGETVAPNTSFLFSKQTAMGGRKNRGRLYLPGVLEGAIGDGGDLGSSWITDLNAAAALMLASLTADGLPMYILHESVDAPTEVTAMFVSSRVATQRRRLRR